MINIMINFMKNTKITILVNNMLTKWYKLVNLQTIKNYQPIKKDLVFFNNLKNYQKDLLKVSQETQELLK